MEASLLTEVTLPILAVVIIGFGWINRRIDKLEVQLNGRMDKLEVRMDKLEARLDRLEGRITALESRMTAIETILHMLRFTVQFTPEEHKRIGDKE